MEIQTFESADFGAIRVSTVEGESWFVASDVCAALGLSQVTNSVKRLDDDERTLISIKGRSVNAVNEPGL